MNDTTTKEAKVSRVLAAKKKLPGQYVPIILHFFPEIEGDKKAIDAIRATVGLRSLKEENIKKLEHAAQNYQKP